MDSQILVIETPKHAQEYIDYKYDFDPAKYPAVRRLTGTQSINFSAKHMLLHLVMNQPELECRLRYMIVHKSNSEDPMPSGDQCKKAITLFAINTLNLLNVFGEDVENVATSSHRNSTMMLARLGQSIADLAAQCQWFDCNDVYCSSLTDPIAAAAELWMIMAGITESKWCPWTMQDILRDIPKYVY